MKMKLLLASNNRKKLQELKDILQEKFDIVTLAEAGVVSEPEETGKTFAENAYIKAYDGMRLSGMACLADDSGLAVDALGGAPGVLSARYAGEHGNDQKNNELLLKNLQGVEDRSAQFVCAICLVYPDGRTVTAEGQVHGQILTEPHGENGFGYDPLFYVKEYDQTFAQLPAEVKNRISHRAVALKQFMSQLEEKQ